MVLLEHPKLLVAPAVRPYAGDVPFTSPTELFAASGEQRQVYLDVEKGTLDALEWWMFDGWILTPYWL